MNIVENTNINTLENEINKKSEYESNCLEFFLRINSAMGFEMISSEYLISNLGRIYDIFSGKFIPINNGMVELICNLDPYSYYCITEKRYFSIDMLMMMRFKYINPRGRINPRIYDVFNFKIIHKDNNSDNYNLSNLYCKIIYGGEQYL